MSGISNISKNIRKSHCRVKFNRAVLRILSESNKEINKLINNIETYRKKLTIVPNDRLPVLHVPNRIHVLSMWALKHNVTRRSVNDLLKILQEFGLNWLPRDSRTMLKTPRSTNVISMAGGQYWYNGIEHNIRILFQNIQSDLTLRLNINVDGIPLMKSSSTQFWPILANIHSKFEDEYFHKIHTLMKLISPEFPDIEPFVVAIWCGQQKPTDLNAYLGPFVAELNRLIQNGISINGFHINIKVRCIVCDTPARSFLKGKKKTS